VILNGVRKAFLQTFLTIVAKRIHPYMKWMFADAYIMYLLSFSIPIIPVLRCQFSRAFPSNRSNSTLILLVGSFCVGNLNSFLILVIEYPLIVI